MKQSEPAKPFYKAMDGGKTIEHEGERTVADRLDFARFGTAFARLGKSKFRSRFHLTDADRRYIAEKGLATIRRHCEDFIRTRLAPANPPNDGRQTPMRGHPVFIAQHATATCCRGCLERWWKVPRGIPIDPHRQQRMADFLMAWIEQEYTTPSQKK